MSVLIYVDSGVAAAQPAELTEVFASSFPSSLQEVSAIVEAVYPAPLQEVSANA